MIKLLQNWLTAPVSRFSAPKNRVWFALSLTLVLTYSLLALQEALSAEYVIQDDARQHVFWMQRFLEPGLFPDDLIADYFQTVAPAGYKALYHAAAVVGLDPILLHKLLPVGLSLMMAAYAFALCWQLLPVPFAAFCATLLLGQGLGLTDAIVSGTPKAFIYPLMLAFLYYLVRGAMLPCLVAIALQGLFYPQLVFLSAGVLVLRLVTWRDKRLHLSPKGGDRRLCIAGLVVAFLVLLPYALQSDQFGPTLTLADARTLPELSLPGSRSHFFYEDDPASYWLKGRSGLRLATALTPVTNALGLLLPFLLLAPRRLPLVRQMQAGWVLPQLLVSSLVMFVAAHLLLFRLHLPSRYTQHSFRIVLSLAAGIAIVVLIDAALRWAASSGAIQKGGAIALTTVLSAIVLAYPVLVDTFPITAYQIGKHPDLYDYMRSQPEDSLIASLSEEVNNLPSFAQRSILVGSEYAIPYHLGYYRPFRQRATDLIHAQYSPKPDEVRQFIERYGITHWLLDRNAFQPRYVSNQTWIQQHPAEAKAALTVLQGENAPALLIVRDRCRVFQTKGLMVLDAGCVKRVVVGD